MELPAKQLQKQQINQINAVSASLVERSSPSTGSEVRRPAYNPPEGLTATPRCGKARAAQCTRDIRSRCTHSQLNPGNTPASRAPSPRNRGMRAAPQAVLAALRLRAGRPNVLDMLGL